MFRNLNNVWTQLLFAIAVMSSGCAQLDIDTGDPCVAASAKLDECGAVGAFDNFQQCTPALAQQVLDTDCSQVGYALQAADEELVLKGRVRRSDGNWLCRLGFMTNCPAAVCEPEEGIEIPSEDDDCIEWARFDGCAACEYYRCREKESQCGPDGYLLGYVGKYCDRFSTVTEPRLSDAGAAWMEDVRHCLVRELETQTDEYDSCDTIAQVGTDSHANCYVQSGFCDLSFTDWFGIIHTIDAFDIPFRQILATGHGCLKTWARRF